MRPLKAKCSVATALFSLLVTTIICLSSCSRSQKDIIPSVEYASYVNAYTGGII